MIKKNSLVDTLLYRLDKLSNGQITAFMLGFSLLLVVVGMFIWQKYGAFNFTGPGNVTVVTTHPLITDMVSYIGGEGVEIIELTPSTSTADLDQAQIMFVAGAGIDEAIVNQIAEFDLVTIRLDRDISPPNTQAPTQLAPYWVSIPNTMIAVQSITDTLVQIMPARANEFTANHDAYIQTLAKEDLRLRLKLNQVENRLLITLGQDWSYLARDYGFQLETVTLDQDSLQITDKLDQLTALHQTKVVFITPEFADNHIQTWAGETGISLVILDAQGKNSDSGYLGLMDYNMSQITNALD